MIPVGIKVAVGRKVSVRQGPPEQGVTLDFVQVSEPEAALILESMVEKDVAAALRMYRKLAPDAPVDLTKVTGDEAIFALQIMHKLNMANLVLRMRKLLSQASLPGSMADASDILGIE